MSDLTMEEWRSTAHKWEDRACRYEKKFDVLDARNDATQTELAQAQEELETVRTLARKYGEVIEMLTTQLETAKTHLLSQEDFLADIRKAVREELGATR